MGRLNTYFHSFATGVQDATALPRVDLERMRLAAEVQTNLLPKATGPGFMRPGLEYLSSTDGNAVTRLKEFVFGATDAALMEFSNASMRVRNSDVLITRPAVTATVTSGTFSSGTGWTLTATAGATSTVSGGYLNLTALARGSSASATQTVTVNEQGTEHALRIVVERGPVTFRCGSTSGGDEYIAETTLRTGTHSLAFTPTTASFHLKFQSEDPNLKRVDSITVEGAGVMELPTPWLEADLDLMRFAQSADVVFVACRGYQQRRIERRALRSWSVVLYQSDDGPFGAGGTRGIRLKPSIIEGNGTLTASANFFTSNHVGAIFRLFHGSQHTQSNLSAEDFPTEAIRVTGVGSDNNFILNISGTWSGTLTLQRSYDGPDSGFINQGPTYTMNQTNLTIDPGTSLDNVIQWYRVLFNLGDYTSGVATVSLTYGGGGNFGVARVVGYSSPTVVNIEVLKPFSRTTFTSDWREGEWSAAQIWPSAGTFSDGRLWWSGSDRLWGSVSDAFESFDEELEGDAGPISRSIATGGVNDTQWLLALQRLIIGTEGAIAVAKSSSLDEPLTPTNIGIRDSATTGVAAIDPAKLDGRGLVIERAGRAVLEIIFDGATADYNATQLSKLTTDLFSAGVKTLAVQRRPDTRVWIVTNDGDCICCVYEPDQEVLAFVPMETDGDFESVAVLPATTQDRVYFVVNRTVNGGTVRYVEKMSQDSEVKPDTLCRVMDSHLVATNSPASATVSGLTHLIGETVVAWADGAPVETSPGVRAEFTVSGSGEITLPSAVTNVVVGLPYRMRYKSARLAYGSASGTSMLVKKTVDELGLIMTDFTRKGIRFGSSFEKMYDMPSKVLGKTPPDIVLSTVHDEVPFDLGGGWSLDSRVHIECASPYTMMALGMTVAVTAND
ncbi:hypothetical protein [Chelativorans xinjiangense]|uniref:hypothetical protein n=1 Tax=Chelativorans xinjiangense TaxID=2681485 RepID=UPI0013577272|nr:hypothetical protein [Chelativorans xinjiangense]